MSNDLAQLEAELLAHIAGAADLAAIEQVRIAALGKKGRVAELMSRLGSLPAEERKTFGQSVNALKSRVAEALEARKADLDKAALSARLAAETADVTLPVRTGPVAEGRIHPVAQVIDEFVEIFADMGFSCRRGPRHRERRLQLHQAQHPGRSPGAADARHLLSTREGRRHAPALAHTYQPRPDPCHARR